MKILVATREGQGMKVGDFFFATEGEVVTLGSVCGIDRDDPDGGCGCGRAFSGLNSHKASTTAKVAEVPLTRADLVLAVGSSQQRAGWYADEGDPAAEEEVDDLLDLASQWPLGTVLERRLEDVRPRAVS